MTPHLLSDVKPRLNKFRSWLAERGAEVLAATNEWEVIRFRTGQGTSIVYTNKHGRLKWTGQAAEAYRAMSKGDRLWRAAPRSERRTRSNPTCRTLRERDGDDCFFCHLPVEVEDESVEHLGALTQGFPDHLSNMALAHRVCNAEVGHRSIMEKIRFREECWQRLHTPGTVANLAVDMLTAREDSAIEDLFDRSKHPPAAETSPPWETE